MGDAFVVEVEGDEAMRERARRRARVAAALVRSVTPKRETLEDLFVRRAL